MRRSRPASVNRHAGGGNSNSLDLSSTSSPGDVLECIILSDSNGADSASVTAAVQNRAPVMSGVSIAPNSGVTVTLTCTGQGDRQ